MSRKYIAAVLKRLRVQSGLTAKEVGEKIGKSGKTVSAWENNHGQPDAEILLQLCDIYNVDNILEEFRENEKPIYKVSDIILGEHERELVLAYRRQPSMQEAVDKLLGLEPEKIEIKKQA